MHSDDAFDLVTPDNDSWVPQPDVDYNDLPWEVQDVTPLDDDEDDEGDEDDEDDEGDEDEEVLEIAAIA